MYICHLGPTCCILGACLKWNKGNNGGQRYCNSMKNFLSNFIRKFGNKFKKPKIPDIPKISKSLKEMDVHKTRELTRELTGKLTKKVNKKFKKYRRTLTKKGLSQLWGQIDFDKIFDCVFRPGSRPFIHWGFLALLAILPTYLVGRMLGLSLQSPTAKNFSSPSNLGMSGEDLPPLRQQMQFIESNDLFKAHGEVQAAVDCKATPEAPECSPQKKVDPNLVCHDAEKRSSLPITLLSTIVLQDEVKSVASVQVRGEKSLLNLRKGEEIPRLAEITGIHSSKLIIKNKSTGLCEFVMTQGGKPPPLSSGIKVERNLERGKKLLQASQNTGISVTGDNKFKIKKSLRDSMLGNIGEVLTQARAIQIKNPDGSLSFRMQEIVPGSIYSKLNIENGDIITKINGKGFTSVNDVMSLFGQLKERDQYEINIVRNGVEQKFEYNFE